MYNPPIYTYTYVLLYSLESYITRAHSINPRHGFIDYKQYYSQGPMSWVPGLLNYVRRYTAFSSACYQALLLSGMSTSSAFFHYSVVCCARCWQLRQFATPVTCENWFELVNSCVYYVHQTHEIYQILANSVDVEAPGELWNPLSKIVLWTRCSTWNKGHINICNDSKVQK